MITNKMTTKFPKPEKFSTTIEATTEVALERAMFNKLTTRGSEADKIEWLDMELPLDNKGKNRLDLIGRLQIKKKYVICEVKFGDMFSASNNPRDAADEVVRYFSTILNNKHNLSDCHHKEENDDHIGGKPFNWEDINDNNTELIVVANAAYWAYWIGHRKMPVPISGEHKGVCFDVKCYSIDIPKNYFEIQKGASPQYKPSIDDEIRIDPL